jgi:mannose-1-phosphate guanylyltransferase/phosphomannomutase
MKAIIMAGGRGERLQPLTCGLPKPLCPLLGKPVVEYILELLQRHGLSRAVLTLGYQGIQLEEALAEYPGMELDFSREESPLGTAGGVRHAAPEADEELLVISGDAMCDFDLRSAIRFHHAMGADATIFGYRVEDPREYGLLCTDQKGWITSFVEKPSYAGCVTDLANTGIYLLSPKVVEMIPEEGASDFARDIFPRMLECGMKLACWEGEGYWCDIGSIGSYLRCQTDMLAGRVHFTHPAQRSRNGNLILEKAAFPARIIPPVFLGRDVSIGAGSIIGPGTVLGDHVRIGERCRISGSVFLPRASVGEDADIRESLFCEGASAAPGTECGKETVLGVSAEMGRQSRAEAGSRIWPGTRLAPGRYLQGDLEAGEELESLFGEDGISGESLTPEMCLRIGRGVAGLSRNPSIGIGYTAQSGAKALALACLSGALTAGANGWNFGSCFESQFDFCMAKSGVEYGIFVDADTGLTVRLKRGCGMPLYRREERSIEAEAAHRGGTRVSLRDMGCEIPAQSIAQLYSYELVRSCNLPLEQFGIQVCSESQRLRLFFEQVLGSLGCHTGEWRIRLSPQGKLLELSDGRIALGQEQLLAAACLPDLTAGREIPLPAASPWMLDVLAARCGGKILRYSPSSDEEEDHRLAEMAAARPYLRDGLMAAIRLLAFLAEKRIGLKELAGMIPPCRQEKRVIPVPGNPGGIIRKLAMVHTVFGEGVELTSGERRAYLRPLRSGKGFTIFSEGAESETAQEICDFFEGIVRKAALDIKPNS